MVVWRLEALVAVSDFVGCVMAATSIEMESDTTLYVCDDVLFQGPMLTSINYCFRSIRLKKSCVVLREPFASRSRTALSGVWRFKPLEPRESSPGDP